MRPQDIVIGKSYRLKDTPDYGFVKALRVLNIKEINKTKNYLVVECEHTVQKNDTCGFKRYFRPRDIIEDLSTPTKDGEG